VAAFEIPAAPRRTEARTAEAMTSHYHVEGFKSLRTSVRPSAKYPRVTIGSRTKAVSTPNRKLRMGSSFLSYLIDRVLLDGLRHVAGQIPDVGDVNFVRFLEGRRSCLRPDALNLHTA
jgi:hypothetical protein